MRTAKDGYRGTADFHEDGEMVRRSVTIRRPLADVQREWDGSIEGVASFKEAPGDRGTEVRVLAPKESRSTLKELVGSFTGDSPGDSLTARLRAFKSRLETGEVATVHGGKDGTLIVVGDSR
ncbi:MAG: hypothetical protein ABIT20_21780 [Gemmatimonadaceae bacterium]